VTTIAHRLYQLWQQNPEKKILRLLHNNLPDQAYTYSDLMAGASGYAHALENTGTKPGNIVIILLQHGERLVFAFWGAILQGAVPSIMPFLTEKLSPDQYRQSISALISITQPSAIITYSEFIPEVELALGSSHSNRKNCRIIDSQKIIPNSDYKRMIFTDRNRVSGDIALLQHSSGTTGLQKGVALSHQAIFNQLANYTEAVKLTEDDTIVSWLPLYHDMGLIAGFVMPILCGVPLVLLSPLDWIRAPYRIFQAVTQYHGSLMWLPNFAYNFCAKKIRDRELDQVDLSSLRAVINCSEPMYLNSHHVFLERFFPYGLKPKALATCYAMAENVFAVTQGGIESKVTVDLIDAEIFATRKQALPSQNHSTTLSLLSAGTPIANTKIKILSDDKQELPERRIGEIALFSDCMLTEYYQRPDITQDAFYEGWYLTGDLGYLADGELFVTGRKKDLIIVGGKNIYPQDLEYLASMVEGVHPGRVVAFGVVNVDSGTEDVVLIAESSDEIVNDELAHRRLADAIRAKVTQGSDIALRYVLIVEKGWLLKTSSGKIARSYNREKFLAQR
jgi:fatty-acyl-CoA synthase